MSWVAVAIGGSAIIGGAASVYGANKAASAAGKGRDLAGELNTINDQYTNLQNQLTGGQGFNQYGANSLNDLANGTSIDWAKYAQSPAVQKHIQESGDYYSSLGGTWSDIDKAKNFYNNGYDPNAQLPTTGGISNISSSLNTENRTSNLNDVKNLAQDYTNLMRGTNADYYNQLNTFTNAANAPINPSASQNQAAGMAQQGFGTFNPSGLNANTSFTSNNVTADSGNPLLSQLNQQAMGQGPSALQTQQNQLAQGLLAQGGKLSESDLRNIQQNSRAGFAARGLDATNASVVDETFQTDQAQRARLLQNLGIAQGVQNQGLQEQNLQNQFALGVGNQNYGYSQLGLGAQEYNNNANLQAQQLGLQGQIANQNFGLNSFNANLNSQLSQEQALQQQQAFEQQQKQSQLNAMLAATQAQQQGTLDPYSAILSGTNQNLLPSALNLYGQNQSTQNNLINALYGYGSDLNNTNYNASVSSGIAQGNAYSNLGGSLIGVGGQLGGAYLKNKSTTA